MNYTVKQMAEISGVSARTLRFYDERSLLKPAFLSEAGYRMYTEKEIDRLQQILLYRSMGIPLKTIKELVDRPDEKSRGYVDSAKNPIGAKAPRT